MNKLITKIFSKRSMIYVYVALTSVFSFVAFAMYNTYQRSHSPQYMIDEKITQNVNEGNYQKVVFAGGCFWCTESEFNHEAGVVSAVSGYADSDKANPSYEETGNGTVRAREAVQVIYDPTKITFDTLLEKYWKHIDPTDAGGQFADRGHQYTTAIYYTTPEQKLEAQLSKKKIEDSRKFADKNGGKVATEILEFNNFYPAEEYHQDYKDKNSVRYNLYREGSGRNSYIKLHWKDGSTTTSAIFSDMVTNVNSPNKTQDKKMITIKEVNNKPWLSFNSQIKAEKLKTLTATQFDVTQDSGTEKPFTNLYAETKDLGLYVDIVSGEPLFLSSDKFDSGTGWPSFVKPVSADAVTLHVDKGIFSTRTEVKSKIADSHLGHVFDDGPRERGGRRYCMNSAALRFIAIADMEKEGYGDYVSMLK